MDGKNHIRGKKRVKETKLIEEEMEIEERDLLGKKQAVKKRKYKAKVYKKFKEEIDKIKDLVEGKTKMKRMLQNKQEWKARKCPEYMRCMTRHETSLIFKARTSMLDIKANYKKKLNQSTMQMLWRM